MMPRWLPGAIVIVIGLVLVVNFVVINPTLAGVAGGLQELIVLLAAAAAVTGAIALVLRHWHTVVARGSDRTGSWVVLGGMALMLLAGFYPGSRGAADPAVEWLVRALLAPLIATIFSLLFVFLLQAIFRGRRLRSRETLVMYVAAAVVLVLLLPLGGAVGDWLGAAAAWSLEVPIGAVFRGLLIGIAIATSVYAARLVLGLGPRDE
jgi:hypothetical protein